MNKLERSFGLHLGFLSVINFGCFGSLTTVEDVAWQIQSLGSKALVLSSEWEFDVGFVGIIVDMCEVDHGVGEIERL